MTFRPFRVRVARTQRLSPHFQRITFHGVERMGPKETVRDLRVKLIIPHGVSLPELPEENWYATWKDLDPATRGIMRTYSIRALRRAPAGRLAGTAHDELDVDFVLHPEAAGPASSWAQSAQVGEEIILIGPARDDDSGTGIEFTLDNHNHVVMLGDETALPAIAKTLEEWPVGKTGEVFIEIPCKLDAQKLSSPPGVAVQMLPRDCAAPGSLLYEHLEQLVMEVTAGRPALSETEDAAYDPELVIWETPRFSRAGQSLAADASDPSTSPFADTYFWIAGESAAVIQMRRLLVNNQVPRQQISFMGYWKRGIAMQG
ncbi:siderophore-interacting protein [Corynebacterium hindlerae]|uniref:siderophore-interacting protein n=1 Tax=Corynebacterium hindlerae TaxID=699041 RepID=UPI0031B695C1